MNHRELLEMAAKAAGYRWPLVWPHPSPIDVPHHWNPLTDDGDALRLAARLCMSVDCDITTVRINWAVPMAQDCRKRVWVGVEVPVYTLGYEAATRLAIVVAAAQIGKEY